MGNKNSGKGNFSDTKSDTRSIADSNFTSPVKGKKGEIIIKKEYENLVLSGEKAKDQLKSQF